MVSGLGEMPRAYSGGQGCGRDVLTTDHGNFMLKINLEKKEMYKFPLRFIQVFCRHL